MAAAFELGEMVSTIADFDQAYEALMSRSAMLPLGDIVGAGALRVVADGDPDRFTRIIHRALSDTPNTETIPAGTILQVSVQRDVAEIEMPEPSTMVGNIHPWLVLAQMAVLPMAKEHEDEGPSPNGTIIATVGAFEGFLRPAQDERLHKMVGFHFHEIPGKGAVPCLQHGVVEPIGQAIISGFFLRPTEMVSMTKHAITKDRFHLAWRLNTAAREMTSATDPAVAEAAATSVAMTDQYLQRHYLSPLHEGADLNADESPAKPPED
jgi:hypothetical protein